MIRGEAYIGFHFSLYQNQWNSKSQYEPLKAYISRMKIWYFSRKLYSGHLSLEVHSRDLERDGRIKLEWILVPCGQETSKRYRLPCDMEMWLSASAAGPLCWPSGQGCRFEASARDFGNSCKGDIAEEAAGCRANTWTWYDINPLNAELNFICHLLELLGDLTFRDPCIVSIFRYTCISKKDATLHSLFISGNCSTCFRW
jgi:hypothetical protein